MPRPGLLVADTNTLRNLLRCPHCPDTSFSFGGEQGGIPYYVPSAESTMCDEHSESGSVGSATARQWNHSITNIIECVHSCKYTYLCKCDTATNLDEVIDHERDAHKNVPTPALFNPITEIKNRQGFLDAVSCTACPRLLRPPIYYDMANGGTYCSLECSPPNPGGQVVRNATLEKVLLQVIFACRKCLSHKALLHELLEHEKACTRTAGK